MGLLALASMAAASSAQAQKLGQPLREDVVARISSGVSTIRFDRTSTVSPLVQDGGVYLRLDDRSCVPTTSKPCTYHVQLLRVALQNFSFQGHSFSGIEFRNERTIDVRATSPTGQIPANTIFDSQFFDGSDLWVTSMSTNTGVSIIMAPDRNQLVLSGSLTGFVNGHQMDLTFLATADAPFVNGPPKARIAVTKSVSPDTCVGSFVLDSTGTTDPDGNLRVIRWSDNGRDIGTGATLTIPSLGAGAHHFVATAIDAFGGSDAAAADAACSAVGEVLGFESFSDWSSPTASMALTDLRTQGLSSLEVLSGNFNFINSVPLNTADLRRVVPAGVKSVTIDIRIPTPQPNQFWIGALQMYVSVPSANINNDFLGQVELTGKFQNAFITVSFPLDTRVLAALQGDHNDFSFSIALNVNTGAPPFLMDNIRFVNK